MFRSVWVPLQVSLNMLDDLRVFFGNVFRFGEHFDLGAIEPKRRSIAWYHCFKVGVTDEVLKGFVLGDLVGQPTNDSGMLRNVYEVVPFVRIVLVIVELLGSVKLARVAPARMPNGMRASSDRGHRQMLPFRFGVG
jgi:hypothetical protein